MNTVRVFGADWCEDTQATLNHLDSLGAHVEYHDIDRDEQARQWVKQQNGGTQRTPTLDVCGQILVEPSEHDLELTLRRCHAMH